MTCELFDGDCDNCDIEYCPDQMEELNFKHMELREGVEQAEKDLEYAKEELSSFVEDHKSILIGP